MDAYRTLVSAESQADLFNAGGGHNCAMQVRAGLGNFYGMAPVGALGTGFEVPPVAKKDHVIGWLLAVAADFGFSAPPGILISLTTNHGFILTRYR